MHLTFIMTSEMLIPAIKWTATWDASAPRTNREVQTDDCSERGEEIV